MKDEHPLYYKKQPAGLRINLKNGEVIHVGSQYLESRLNSTQTQITIYYSTSVIRVIGTGLGAISEGLEDEEHELGKLARISERPPADASAILPPGPGQVRRKITVTSIRVKTILDDPFCESGETESETESEINP
jgi:hypothetical protein